MLLKLIPLPSQPTIHFSLNLPTFPSHLDPPQSYTAQINHLLVEDLEIPNTLHSLDKSVGLMSLLEEVIFEIKDGTADGGGGGGGEGGEDQLTGEKAVRVTCRFVDGALEEWVTKAAGLISALETIIQNVQESTLEEDNERERYCQSQLQNNRSRALNKLSIPPSSTPLLSMKPRHKKQRSLFMQIVSYVPFFFPVKLMIPSNFIFHSSIVNLTSPSSSSASHLPTFVDPCDPGSFYTPPPSPISNTPPLSAPSSSRARLLRRTARSSLVNTYRRHVLPELNRRFPKEGGFGVWILHSMRRRALERMEDLIREGARLQQQQQQQQEQQVLELRQRHKYEEREQEQQCGSQQGWAKFHIHVDERSHGPRASMEEGGFSATTMAVPLSFSDEGGSTENENESTNSADRNGNGNSEQVEDDLETITDGSSVHTPSSTSHIGTGFMGGCCSSPTLIIQPPGLPFKSPLSNPQPFLPPHLHFEYTQLSRLRQRLQSLVLFADSQVRIAETEKRNRDEILLVRGRRRAWLNGELGAGTANGMRQMQWGFAAPFNSSPLARYSWSASVDVDQSAASPNDANDTSLWFPDVQQQADEEDEDEYDEFHGPPVVRKSTLSYGRQSCRLRYGGTGTKLPPVTEEFESESAAHDSVDGTLPELDAHSDDPFRHRNDLSLYRHQEDEDVDSLSDGFSLEDPRELDLELGFGLQEPTPFDGEDLLRDDSSRSEPAGVQEYSRRRSGESARVAFEMERPKIIPRVRDGIVGGDDDSIMSVDTSTSSSTSTRSGGILSWSYWGVGKSSGNSDGTIRRCRSWKNGIGLGSRGRSLNKTCERREEEEEQLPRLRRRTISTSSTSSTASTSSTKSQQQQQQQQPQHQAGPTQVDPERQSHDQDQNDSSTIPLLCRPVSFSVSHTPAQAATQSVSTSTVTAPTTPMTVAIPPVNDTTTSPNETKADAPIPATNGPKTFVPTPLSFTTKKLRMTSPTPNANVYADLDVSVVHMGDDDKGLSLAFGANQSVNPGVNHIDVQDEPGHSPRLRPRRHKREYQYPHACGNEAPNNGQEDECDEFELSGYGQFTGSDNTHLSHPKNQHQRQRQNSMIHARLHLDELLLEEGLFGRDTSVPPSDQEEFTLAMDIPFFGGGGGGGRAGKKALRKKQYLQLHQNRDSVASQQTSQQPSRLQMEQPFDHHHHPVSLSLASPPSATESESVVC